jgi:Flp pilus assembly protein TadG
MALVLPLLLLLVFGIIDFGRMLHAQIILTEAAREGARAAALHLPAKPRVQSALDGMLEVSDGQITVVECPPEAADLTKDADVTVSHAFTPVTPIGPLLRVFTADGGADGAVTITARGVMPCVG